MPTVSLGSGRDVAGPIRARAASTRMVAARIVGLVASARAMEPVRKLIDRWQHQLPPLVAVTREMRLPSTDVDLPTIAPTPTAVASIPRQASQA